MLLLEQVHESILELVDEPGSENWIRASRVYYQMSQMSNDVDAVQFGEQLLVELSGIEKEIEEPEQMFALGNSTALGGARSSCSDSASGSSSRSEKEPQLENMRFRDVLLYHQWRVITRECTLPCGECNPQWRVITRECTLPSGDSTLVGALSPVGTPFLGSVHPPVGTSHWGVHTPQCSNIRVYPHM
jgi:hypothetical protein